MELKQFENKHIEEIAMIEVAKAVLEQKGEVMSFDEIIKDVASFLKLTKKEVERRIPQFYTDINVDGEFISLGENSWGLRTWYPIDAIDEVLTHENDETDIIPSISPDGFDDYEGIVLEEELEDEEDVEVPEGETYADIDGDGTVENLDDYQDDIVDLDSDALDDGDLDGLAIVDDEDLEEDDLEDEEF